MMFESTGAKVELQPPKIRTTHKVFGKAVSMLSRYLREQGDACLRWGRQSFDLTIAEKLRMMGEEFIRKAEELERQEGESTSLRELDDGKTDTSTPLETGRDGA